MLKSFLSPSTYFSGRQYALTKLNICLSQVKKVVELEIMFLSRCTKSIRNAPSHLNAEMDGFRHATGGHNTIAQWYYTGRGGGAVYLTMWTDSESGQPVFDAILWHLLSISSKYILL